MVSLTEIIEGHNGKRYRAMKSFMPFADLLTIYRALDDWKEESLYRKENRSYSWPAQFKYVQNLGCWFSYARHELKNIQNDDL